MSKNRGRERMESKNSITRCLERMEVTERQRIEWLEIFHAAEAGDAAKLDELVSVQGVDLDLQIETSAGFTSVLHMLAERGITHGAELLIRKGANIEMTCGNPALTALHIAAKWQHANVVQRLIELGANVHARASERPDGSFNMPLHLVAQYGSDKTSSVQILRQLLDHGSASDFLIGDADGDTPLHCATVNTTIPHVIIKELLNILATSSSSVSCGLKPSTSSVVNMQNRKGQTPLHTAVGFGNIEAAQLLLNAGASKDACDAYGATPFHYAARSGHVRALDMLNAEDVDAPAIKNHFRALHYAAWNKRHEAVDWLLQHKASVNVSDTCKGDTPLHLAARRGDPQMIQMLIKKGSADILLTNHKKELALGLADDRGHHEAAKAFVKAITRAQNREDRLKDLGTKHSRNGASLLHYFAAYGTEKDMEWLLEVTNVKMSAFDYRLNTNVNVDAGEAVNIRDGAKRNAVHWAAVKGNKHVLRILAQNNADLNEEDQSSKTPLHLALLNQKTDFCNELMKLKSELPTLHMQDWLSDIGKWMMDYYNQDAKLKKKLASLRDGFKEHKYPPILSNDNETLVSEIPPVYLALYAERVDIAIFIQQHSEGVDDAVNERGKLSGRTSLHWATLLGQRKIVSQLCRKLFKENLTANVEDKCGKTALQYAKEMGEKEMGNEIGKDIEKELMQRSDVRAHIDALYKDRQLYVDAANAILVGAALIAGVTFAGWLQPPLGYANYYNLPKLAAPPGVVDAFQTYAAMQHHAGVRWFWVFNGLSFSFAIATVLAGLVAVVPIPGVYIANSVAHLHRCLLVAAVLLGSSIAFVLVAFAAAGFAVLPPLFKYQAIMLGTSIAGAMPCLLLFIWFWGRLASLVYPRTMRAKPMWKLISSSTIKAKQYTWKLISTSAKNITSTRLMCCQPEIVVHSVSSSTCEAWSTSEGSTNSNGEEPFVDDDYKFGQKYKMYPWNDGLNVLPEPPPAHN